MAKKDSCSFGKSELDGARRITNPLGKRVWFHPRSGRQFASKRALVIWLQYGDPKKKEPVAVQVNVPVESEK